MLNAKRKSPTSFLHRVRLYGATVFCLVLSGTFLDCTTPDGVVDRGTVKSSQRPIDVDPAYAEQMGRVALAKIGYLPIINLARQAGWVTTKERKRPRPIDGSLISMDLAQAAFVSEFVQVFSKYAVAAGVAAFADSPLPGPGDLVGVGIIVIGLIDAGLLAGILLKSLTAEATAETGTTFDPPKLLSGECDSPGFHRAASSWAPLRTSRAGTTEEAWRRVPSTP